MGCIIHPGKKIVNPFFIFFSAHFPPARLKKTFCLLTNAQIHSIYIKYEQERSFLQQYISALKMDAPYVFSSNRKESR